MFMIHMPKTFKVGNTVDCRINKEPARVTWRDAGTLVIEPGDARAIVTLQDDGELNCFICGDSNESAGDYEIDADPKLGGGVVVYSTKTASEEEV